MIRSKSSAKIAKADDGVDVHYWHTHIPGSKKPTIVIHPGGGMNHSSLLTLEQGLNNRGHSTISMDMRGVGYSKAPASSKFYTLKAYSADLQKIIEQESLENPEIFCHSLGGCATLDYVGRTNNASKITGACISPNFSKTTIPGGTWLFRNILPILGTSASIVTGLVHKLKGQERPYSDQSKLEGKSFLSFTPAINDIPISEALKHFSMFELQNWDVSEQLANITCPIHLIHGYLDIMVMPFAAEMIKDRATKTLVTSDKVWTDHTLPYAQPKKVLEIMKKYEQ